MAPFDRSDHLDPVDADGFRRFADLLGHHVGLDLSDAVPTSQLRHELGFDSLAMAEALVVLADHGVVLPDELIPELRTAGDLHHYVTTRATVSPVPARPAVAAR